MAENLYSFIKLTGNIPEDSLGKKILKVYKDSNCYYLYVYKAIIAYKLINKGNKDKMFKYIKNIKHFKDIKDINSMNYPEEKKKLVKTFPLKYEMLDKNPDYILDILSRLIMQVKKL